MITESFHILSLSTLLDSDIHFYSLHQDLSINLSDDFIASIERFGLFHPPVVLKNDKGFTLLCGRKRVLALQKINSQSSLPCKIIDSSDPAELLAVIIEDQLLDGPFSIIMKARLIRLMEALIPKELQISLISDLQLGSYGQLQRLLPLLALEEELRNALHFGSISDKVGLLFCSLSSKDRLFLGTLFVALSLNKNKQKRLLDMCQIIIARDGGSFHDLFHTHFSDFLPENLSSNIPQSASNLLKRLYETSHPLSVSAEKAFDEWKNSLGLPEQIDIEHSPAFERDSVRLSIDFETIEDMSTFWEAIKKQL